YGLSLGTAVVQVASLAVDISILEVFDALTSGGTLVIPPSLVTTDPGRLWGFIGDTRPTVVQLVPSALEQMSALAGARLDDRARNLVLGGEEVSPQIARVGL